MAEKKERKISHKIYFNDRLKQVDFHGVSTHPLYIQVTYERKSIFFKSYYFTLFGKSKFRLKIPGVGEKGPAIKNIIEKETELINHIIAESKQVFSLEAFKKDYDAYSTDLCDILEEGFIDYLYTFFWDEGLPAIGDLCKYGHSELQAYDLVRDFKRSLKPELYKSLIDNSVHYAPPYFQIYGYMESIRRWPMVILTAMEMQDAKIVNGFQTYLGKHYLHEQAKQITEELNHWLKSRGLKPLDEVA
ncbi:hypothetical protein [Pedobacter aquatilis]|uniref:hypothetical protein n=1 Tax=Pedobacter aquatilis TaxID=351343 RepID=UPI00292F1F78|nr:hypothetical protein [Pedobacter aquatilis]